MRRLIVQTLKERFVTKLVPKYQGIFVSGHIVRLMTRGNRFAVNTYSDPVSALTGNRPVKSECAVWESDSVLVKTVPRGVEETSGVSTSSGKSSSVVESSPLRC